jgi:hypothetical protein
MSVAFELLARFKVGAALRLFAGLFGLAATALLLSACHGASGRTDQSFWSNLYGDPDTARPDSGGSTCCLRTDR